MKRSSSTWRRIPAPSIAGFICGVLVAVACSIPMESPKRSSAGVLLEQILGIVKSSYVREVDSRQLAYEGINDMLGELDPHSRFIPPADVTEFRESTEGYYVGIGIVTSPTPVDGYPVIAHIFAEGPAKHAGLEEGDRILAVDGKSVQNLGNLALSSLIRGRPDTEIHLRIARDGVEPMDLQVSRGEVHLSSISGLRLYTGSSGKKVGYVRLYQFQNRSSAELSEAYEELKDAGAKEFILDLRGNPGGILDEGRWVAGLFLHKGMHILSTRSRSTRDRPEVFRCERTGPFTDEPLAVLIDGGSASASEIVAAALRDHDRGILVGSESYGKWTVQILIELGRDASDGILKLTTKSFHPPYGKGIRRDAAGHRRGLVPDVVVDMDEGNASRLHQKWQKERFERVDDAMQITRLPAPTYDDPAVGDGAVVDAPLIRAIAILSDPSAYQQLIEKQKQMAPSEQAMVEETPAPAAASHESRAESPR